MIRYAFMALVLSGCFSRPQLANRDGAADGDGSGSGCQPSKPSPSGVFVSSENGEYTAHMLAGSMTFADDGARYPFPIALRTDAQNLVSSPGGCSAEDQIGVAVYPSYSISGNMPIQSSEDHQLTRPIVGAAYTEFLVTWSYSDACGGGLTFHGNGTSTFSFFPDGRIVRNDSFHPVDNIAESFPSNCPCTPPGDNFVVTSYTGLATAALSMYTDAMLGTTTSVPTGENDGRLGGCFLTTENDNIAVRWAMDDQTRLRRASAGEMAWVLDLIVGGNLAESDVAAGRTEMMLRQNGVCADLNRELQNHTSPTRIEIAGTLVDRGPNGYYADEGERTAPITVTAANGRIEAGFSIRVRFPGYSAVATSRDENRVFWQHEDNDVFFLTFRDSLESQDSLEVTPECGS